jgi:hypothetical protein
VVGRAVTVLVVGSVAFLVARAVTVVVFFAFAQLLGTESSCAVPAALTRPPSRALFGLVLGGKKRCEEFW